MNLTTIASPRTPPQRTSPPFEALIVRDHYAASIFNAGAIQIAPEPPLHHEQKNTSHLPPT